MKRQIFLLIFFLASIVTAQTTSNYVQRFVTNSGPLKGAYIYLVPQDSTYPAGALQLTEDASKDGVYYRNAVTDGEYKIYIDPDGAGVGGASLSNRYQHIWIGESRITRVANQFDSNMKLNPAALDTIYLSTNVALKKGEIATALVGGKIVIMIGIDSSGTKDSVASQRWVRAQSFIKFINGTDTVAYRSWVRAQGFGTGSGDCDGYARYLNPDHFSFSDDGDTVSIQDSILIRLIGSIDFSDYMTLSTTQTVTGNKTYSGSNNFQSGIMILPSTETPSSRGQIGLDDYLIFRTSESINDTVASRDFVRDYISQTNLSIQNLLPKTTSVYNLGSSTKRWNYLYVNNISGAAINFYGNSFTFNASVTLAALSDLTLGGKLFLRTAAGDPNPDGSLTLAHQTVYRFTSEGTESVSTLTSDEVDGEIIYFVNETANAVTFYETGNINLSTSTYEMGQGDTLTLLYNAALDKWVELSRSDN